MTSLSEVKQYWTVTIALLSEREVELHASLDSDPERSSETVRCAVQPGLEQLELLFACTPDAEFRLAVRCPDGAFCCLTTRRWRFALYFITAQYERAFVTASPFRPSAALPSSLRIAPTSAPRRALELPPDSTPALASHEAENGDRPATELIRKNAQA